MATVGAVLPGDFKIKKSKLRGVASAGMCCSCRELGLGADHEGIWILPEDAPVGMPFADYAKQMCIRDRSPLGRVAFGKVGRQRAWLERVFAQLHGVPHHADDLERAPVRALAAPGAHVPRPLLVQQLHRLHGCLLYTSRCV